MSDLIIILEEYAPIWMPSLTAIFGVALTVITTLANARKTFKQFKEDKTLSDISDKLDATIEQNKELVRTNKKLIDQITRIQGYCDIDKEV